MTKNKHFRSVFAALLCAVLCLLAGAGFAADAHLGDLVRHGLVFQQRFAHGCPLLCVSRGFVAAALDQAKAEGRHHGA